MVVKFDSLQIFYIILKVAQVYSLPVKKKNGYGYSKQKFIIFQYIYEIVFICIDIYGFWTWQTGLLKVK